MVWLWSFNHPCLTESGADSKLSSKARVIFGARQPLTQVCSSTTSDLWAGRYNIRGTSAPSLKPIQRPQGVLVLEQLSKNKICSVQHFEDSAAASGEVLLSGRDSARQHKPMEIPLPLIK